MPLRLPLWTKHYDDGALRVVETDVATLRVTAPGGQLELGFAAAERLALELLKALGARKVEQEPGPGEQAGRKLNKGA